MPGTKAAERPAPASSAQSSRWGRVHRRLRSRRAIVEDHSMEPAFLPGDRVWFDPSAYRARRPAVGDIVVLSDPAENGRLLIKEVAATQGMTVWVVREGVRVAPPRSDRSPRPADLLEEVEVPAGYLFVASRRATGTRDSRSFGPVPRTRVLGEVWFRYAPLERRGPVGPTRGSRPS